MRWPRLLRRPPLADFPAPLTAERRPMTASIRSCLMALLAVIVVMTAADSSPAQEALKPGDKISGKLRFFRHQHPNGTWINVYQITADNPRKLAEADEFCD